jgi:hypothetical protein
MMSRVPVNTVHFMLLLYEVRIMIICVSDQMDYGV